MRLTKDQCTAGIVLCIRNAHRLVRNAELLLSEREASPSSAYSLWSLAMEEYGKALLLKELCEQNEGKRQTFEVDWKKLFGSGGHKNKFQKAKGELPGLPEKIKAEVQVRSNTSERPTTIRTTDGQFITVLGGMTGSFQDGSNRVFGKINSYDLRFRDFYVGWDSKNNQWQSPDPILSSEPISIEVFDSGDVLKCIRILKEKLEYKKEIAVIKNFLNKTKK
jgi:AbiV family abortive infection protein